MQSNRLEKLNKVEKLEYIVGSIVAQVVCFMGLRPLYFKPIQSCTLVMSMLVFIGISITVTSIGILKVFRYNGNFKSVMYNLILTWGVYCSVAYFEMFRREILVVSIISTSLIILILAWCLWKKRTDKKGFQSYLELLCYGVRGVLVICLMLLLVRIGVRLLFEVAISAFS